MALNDLFILENLYFATCLIKLSLLELRIWQFIHCAGNFGGRNTYTSIYDNYGSAKEFTQWENS